MGTYAKHFVRVIMVMMVVVMSGSLWAAELWIGVDTVSITPSKPVPLSGQFSTRISQTPDNPVTATALALEARQGDNVVDQAILVSCDLVAIRNTIQDRFRERVKEKLPDFDIRKLLLNATHTHTAPMMEEGWYFYDIPDEGVMKAPEYAEFLFDRLSEVVVSAWEKRAPGGVSWTLGHAVVGYNRRIAFADGSSRMYGNTNSPDFRHVEGYEDHGVEMLFFWAEDRKLQAVAINVACPAQEVETRKNINADYWHDVRQLMHQKYGEDLCVVAWCGAAGDQSPHRMFRKQAESRMRTKRNLSVTREIARRIVNAVDETLDVARGDIRTDVPFVHHVEDLQLPVWKITDAQLADAKTRYENYTRQKTLTSSQRTDMGRYKRIMDRYERQKTHPYYDMELHVIRLGDIAIATNPFELFVDYGIQIKARSKPLQTFVIQLACNSGLYLPTPRGVQGGSYSGTPYVSRVGPEGGQVLVDRTVEVINSMWENAQ